MELTKETRIGGYLYPLRLIALAGLTGTVTAMAAVAALVSTAH